MALLNLDNVSGHAIVGLDSEMLNWVTDESSDRMLYELSTSFLDLLNSEELPEIELDNVVVEELNKIEKECIPKSSQKQTDSTI